MSSRITPNLRAAFLKAMVILGPSYFVAYLTDKMVYVVPTLAAAGIFASTIETRDVNRLLDEGGDQHEDNHQQLDA
ncbi:hypothetical protein [uncultured Aliiroseovarius sp.]|uniref:hypothetical protein n=1 Tax=uncultured Aliiroseovarius sp. TaxID=1658783 RepID=UPI002639715A|nr:hypothetical protein [uncultured Aliiroseovarius sp.]